MRLSFFVAGFRKRNTFHLGGTVTGGFSLYHQLPFDIPSLTYQYQYQCVKHIVDIRCFLAEDGIFLILLR